MMWRTARWLVVVTIVSLSGIAEAQFVADDLFVYQSPGFGAVNVTAGGDLSSAPGITTPGLGGVYGTLAWSRDRQIMYVASSGVADKVVTVTPAGVVTDYATGIPGATSVLVTSDGHILVGSFDDGKIFDITGGGDFTSASALVTSLYHPGAMVQLASGEVLVTSGSGGNSVYDIDYPTGGAMQAANQYATGFQNPVDIVQAPDGEIYVSVADTRVFRITGGGSFSEATPFATLADTTRSFRALAVLRDGTLLAQTGTAANLMHIYDITAGGEIASDATPWGVLTISSQVFDRVPACGDGIEQFGEPCDDGNLVDDDDCRNICVLPVCGDGLLHDQGTGTEQCDDGNAVDGDDCTNSCLPAVCGDAVVHDQGAGTEECDDGNESDQDDCLGSCLLATCGDGLVHDQGAGDEECDDGNDSDQDDCLGSCLLATCGDGFVHDQGAGDEECDDGNEVDGDACLNACLIATCGDGVVHDQDGGMEACDDANQADDDDCLSCVAATCGDGVLNSDGEASEDCDDGADNSDTAADACRTACVAAHCGDGVVDTGEECDDGSANGGDSTCTVSCAVAEEAGGCCSTDRRGPGLEHLLFVGLIVLATRRRRRRP